jgi:hypothetical protein
MITEIWYLIVQFWKFLRFWVRVELKKNSWDEIKKIPTHFKIYYFLRLWPLLWYYFMIYTVPEDLKSMVDKESNFDSLALEDIFKVSHALNILLIYFWINMKVYLNCKFKKFYYCACVFWVMVFYSIYKYKLVNSCKYLDISLDTYYNHYKPIMKDQFLHRNPNPMKYKYTTNDGTCEWKRPKYCWHFALDGYAKIFYLEDQ